MVFVSELDLSPEAAKVWDAVAEAHGDNFERIAGPDLEAYCVQVARMRDARKRIDSEGLVVADEKGRPIPHPALVLERDAQREIRAWGDRFAPPRRRRSS